MFTWLIVILAPLIFELIINTVCYPTGSLLIRIFTFGQVRYPFWGRKVLQQQKKEVDHLMLCIVVGLVFYMGLIFALFLVFSI